MNERTINKQHEKFLDIQTKITRQLTPQEDFKIQFQTPLNRDKFKSSIKSYPKALNDDRPRNRKSTLLVNEWTMDVLRMTTCDDWTRNSPHDEMNRDMTVGNGQTTWNEWRKRMVHRNGEPKDLRRKRAENLANKQEID